MSLKISFNKLVTAIMLLSAIAPVSAQDYILDLSNTEYITVQEELKGGLIENANYLFNQYVKSGDFATEEKIILFESLFDPDRDVFVFDDLETTISEEQIDVFQYIDYSNFLALGERLKFNITSPKLTYLKREARGAGYTAEIVFSKESLSYFYKTELDDRDNPIMTTQIMRIKIDPYDKEASKIIDIRGEVLGESGPAVVLEDQKKEQKKKEAQTIERIEDIKKEYIKTLSISLVGSAGTLRLNDVKVSSTASIGNVDAASYLGVAGLDIRYRQTLDRKQKLFLSLGIQGVYGTFNTPVSAYQHIGDLSASGLVRARGELSSVPFNESGSDFNMPGSDDNVKLYLAQENSIIDGEETINLINTAAHVGLSYELLKSRSIGSSLWRLLVDANVGVQLGISTGGSNIDYSGVTQNALVLPNDGLFPFTPQEVVEEGLAPFYITDQQLDLATFNGRTSGSINPFGQIGLTFLKATTKDAIGIEAGISYTYGFGKYFDSDSSDTFLVGSQSIYNSSVTQQFYEKNSLTRLNARIGVYINLAQVQ